MLTEEILTTLVGGGGVLTTVGAAISFLWAKIENRFTSIETQLDDCRKREHISKARSAVKLTVIELLWQEIERITPDNAILRRAKRLLDDLKTEIQEGEEYG